MVGRKGKRPRPPPAPKSARKPEEVAHEFVGQRDQNDCFVSGVLNISGEFARRHRWPMVALKRAEAREITDYHGALGSVAKKIAPAWNLRMRELGMANEILVKEATLPETSLQFLRQVIANEGASFPLVGVSAAYQRSNLPPYRVPPKVGVPLESLPDHVLVPMGVAGDNFRLYDPYSHRGATDGARCVVDIPPARLDEWWRGAQFVQGWMVWLETAKKTSLYTFDERRV